MSSQFFHRLTISCACVALVTVTFGALVTTTNAGMAFTDWPTSDGYLMVTYPWLKDFARNWDKFLEHGHRLAGMLIGMWTIAVVVVAFLAESRRWVKVLSIGVLLGVISQGLLGGFRVQLDERGLAMLHGIFAGVVFSMMGTLCVVTGKTWREIRFDKTVPGMISSQFFATALVALTLLQYVVGSFIRHKGTGLHEHYGLGLTVLFLALVNALMSQSTGVKWLSRSAWTIVIAMLGQVVLGLSVWALKYGIASWGVVAVSGSTLQMFSRTAHMVWGAVTFQFVVVHLVRVWRTAAVMPPAPEPVLEIRPNAATPCAGGDL